MKNQVFLLIILHNLMLNHVVMTQKFFNWHLNDNIFIQNVRICPSQTTFVIFGSYFQSHNMNLSSWSYSWIKPLASRLVDPIPLSWFSLADFGELNPYIVRTIKSSSRDHLSFHHAHHLLFFLSPWRRRSRGTSSLCTSCWRTRRPTTWRRTRWSRPGFSWRTSPGRCTTRWGSGKTFQYTGVISL